MNEQDYFVMRWMGALYSERTGVKQVDILMSEPQPLGSGYTMRVITCKGANEASKISLTPVSLIDRAAFRRARCR